MVCDQSISNTTIFLLRLVYFNGGHSFSRLIDAKSNGEAAFNLLKHSFKFNYCILVYLSTQFLKQKKNNKYILCKGDFHVKIMGC